MVNNSIEFECNDGMVFISDVSIYNTISYEACKNWNTDKVRYYKLKLSYFHRYNDIEGYVTCDKDTDYFEFNDKEKCLQVYEKIKNMIRK